MNVNVLIGKRAISPVIATILLVAVTLVIAVSSTVYYTSVVGAYTGFEEVEVRRVKVYPVSNLKGPTNNVLKGFGWNVSMTLKNAGTKQATLEHFLLNGRPLDAYDRVAVFDGSGYVPRGDVSIPIPCGCSRQIFIAIKNGEDAGSDIVFSPGLHLEVTLQSAAGIAYLQFVTLP